MAPWASASLGISTKPKPCDRPVSRSVAIRALSTMPKGSKSCESSSSVVVQVKFPTKIFEDVSEVLSAILSGCMGPRATPKPIE